MLDITRTYSAAVAYRNGELSGLPHNNLIGCSALVSIEKHFLDLCFLQLFTF